MTLEEIEAHAKECQSKIDVLNEEISELDGRRTRASQERGILITTCARILELKRQHQEVEALLNGEGAKR